MPGSGHCYRFPRTYHLLSQTQEATYGGSKNEQDRLKHIQRGETGAVCACVFMFVEWAERQAASSPGFLLIYTYATQS